jgi:hypothetical protein
MILDVLPLAHGLGQREDLPLPEDIFIITAATVLAVSFVALAVLWPKPRLEGTEAEWRPLPGPLAGFFGSRALRIACGVIGVLLLALTTAALFLGPENPTDNFGSNLVFVEFWVGFVFACAIFGNVFRPFNPWLAIGEALRFRGRRAYPERLGHWPAAAGLLGFGLLELLPSANSEPRNAGVAVVVYTILTLAAMWVYGARTWADRGEAFGVYFDLVGRISPFEARDGRAGRRKLLSGLTRWVPRSGSVMLLAVLIGITTFDGFSSNSIWADMEAELSAVFEDLGLSIDGAASASSAIGLLLAIGVVAGFYTLGIAGARTVGGNVEAGELRRRFVHSLLPIAVVYVLAHYLTLLVFQGQAMRYLASDPLGEGWDVFGTADAAIDFGVISQNLTWYLQVAFVVLGHVAALVLAHDRALAVYDNARLAVRSQYWMLLIMIGFTTLALWLLKSAGA